MLRSSTYQAKDLTLGQENNVNLGKNQWEGGSSRVPFSVIEKSKKDSEAQASQITTV